MEKKQQLFYFYFIFLLKYMGILYVPYSIQYSVPGIRILNIFIILFITVIFNMFMFYVMSKCSNVQCSIFEF